MPLSTVSASMASASRARKPDSPSISKMTGILTPQRLSISRSESTKRRRRRRARSLPTVVLPAPIMPTRKMFPPPFISSIVGTKTAGETRPLYCSRQQETQRSANREPFGDDPWRDEHQQLRLVAAGGGVLEEKADERQVAEERHLGDVGAVVLFVNTADDDRSTVLHQHLGLDVLGVDLHASCRRGARLVFVDVERHDDVAVRRDLRLDLQRQVGLAERHRRGARRRRLLIRDLGSLLDHCLDLVGGEDARTGDDLALAVGLHRRDFYVEEARQGAVEQDERNLPCGKTVG